MSIKRFGLIPVLAGGLAVVMLLASGAAQAKPEYAAKEGVTCDYCHVVAGGDRNFRGLYYGTHDHSFASFDEVYEAKAAGVKIKSMGPAAKAMVDSYPDVKAPAALDFTMKDIDGKNVKLARYTGNVIMMVNVASLCGNTPQYASLEKLYEKYKAKGFTILAFPANDFGKQEPGTNKEIKEFCSTKYAVKFPMFSKIAVKGDAQAPLYKYLTDKETDADHAGDIEWNFAKFLLNRKGEVVARIPAGTDPSKPEVVAQIEKLLEEPPVPQVAPAAADPAK